MKRPLNPQKLEDIFQYYLENGFEHTTDEIVASMGVSRKTFFNRYVSKLQSVEMANAYWFSRVQERFREKILECNHPVEELLMYIWEIHYIRENEQVFFQHGRDMNLFVTEEAPFMSMLASIIQKGIRCYHFQEDINVELYSVYLLQNLSHYTFQNEDRVQIIRYMLLPLLTERGLELLDDVDVLSFL